MIGSKLLIYNPAEKPKEQIINEFVIRKKEFEILFDEIKNSDPTVAPQHYLISGQRGMGKTTLILRLKYAIEDDKKLSKRIILIRFSEEQYNIARLDVLWEEVAQRLEVKAEGYVGLYDEMLKHEANKNYEKIAADMLTASLRKNKHRVLLLIDNIGDLLDKFGKMQVHRLREILITSQHIQIVGCSSRVLEHTFSYSEPFFDFFREIRLNPLSKEESFDMLRVLGEVHSKSKQINAVIDNMPQRIEALRRISGGVPRTMAILFDIFIDFENGSAFEDLQHLLDQTNSMYKHRMDDLKPQQQQIIDALARSWGAITPSQILQASKLYRDDVKSNQISAQLQQLVDNQIVEIVPTKGKRNIYRIRERFFNIWYLMRHGKKTDKEEVLWLIRFLETWCSQHEIISMTQQLISSLGTEGYSVSGVYHNTKALFHMSVVEEELKSNLHESAIEFLKKQEATVFLESLEQLISPANGLPSHLFSQDIDSFKSAKTTALKKTLEMKHQELVALKHLSEVINKFQRVIVENDETMILSHLEKIRDAHPALVTLVYAVIGAKGNHFENMFKAFTLLSNNQNGYLKIDLNVIRMALLDQLFRFKQFNFLRQEFEKPDSLLMRHDRPYYYALCHFIGGELEEKYINTPSELKETVDEIIQSLNMHTPLGKPKLKQ